jgi:plasmid stability protein
MHGSVVEAFMGVNLSIKEVPDEVAQRLRARAARNHRSLQGELMAIVEQAARGEEAGAVVGEPVTRFGAGWQRGSKTAEQIADEHRRLYPKPIARVPLAVDIIRADRDSR